MNKEIRRILIVSPGYPRWKGDFTNPMVANVARVLRMAGYHPKVVTMHFPKTPSHEHMDGIEVVRARYAPESLELLGSEGGLIDDIRQSWLCKLLVIPMLATLMIKTLIHARKADLLLVQWVPTALVALPAKWLYRKPMILHSRTYPDTPFWRRVYRLLLPRASGVIYNSSDNSALTSNVYSVDKTAVIGSGINLEQYRRPMELTQVDDGVWKIVSVARLVEFKGLEYALKAVAKLTQEGRHVSLTIIGDGPLRGPLHLLSQELGIEDKIIFKGALAHNEVPQHLWAADVFLLPSIIDQFGRTEGFGAVILEAMAAGLPVIASGVGGITDIVNGDNGILVPEKNPEAIASAVERLLDEKGSSQLFSKKGQEFVQKTYSDEAISHQFMSFLSLALDNNH